MSRATPVEVRVTDGEAEHDLRLTIPDPHLPVAGLLAALEPYLPAAVAARGVLVDGHRAPPDMPTGQAGLRCGATLRLLACDPQDTRDASPDPRNRYGALPTPLVGPQAASPGEVRASVVEVHVVGGLDAGPVFGLPPGRHLVGRDPTCDVVLDAPTVSARHAVLEVHQHGACWFTDVGSTNGSRLGDRFLDQPTPVGTDDELTLGALRLRIRPAPPRPQAPLGAPRPDGTRPVSRPPRPAPPPPPADIALPSPPPPTRPGPRFGWAAVIAPLGLGLGLMLVFRNPMMAAFAVFSPVMLVANWLEDRRRATREEREGHRTLQAQVEDLRRSLETAAVTERQRRRELLPDPAELAARIATRSVRLWERRPGSEGFLTLSAGCGTVSWTPPTSDRAEPPPEVEELLARWRTLPGCPVPVTLHRGRVLGVAGPRPAALALARGLLLQAAALHGPADLRLAVLTEQDRVSAWDWAKWLPHTRGPQGTRLLAGDERSRAWLHDELGRHLTGAAPAAPVTLLLVDADGALEGRHAPVRRVLSGGHALVSGLVLAPDVDRLPAVCAEIVSLEGIDGTARWTDCGSGRTVRDLLAAGVPARLARDSALALAGLDDPETDEDGGKLPARVDLRSLLGLEELDAVRVADRWRAGNAAERLAVPIGLSAGGPLVVDLVGDGPHALIAGTTGSGKSELLRSLVAGLAACFSPTELAFVLVDYKGGSAFDACSGLPHTAGMVTDLDEHLGRRALRCLEAELRYRERVLRAAGASDLPQYRAKRHEQSLPRLLVIIDEFATLAAELPDFIDALVGIAQRGRSLGVHLLLATQRPSGAVSDQIRANTNLRLALRVQDRADSQDVIGTADAATIPRSQPGRGYARLGPGEIVSFQAALVTGRTVPAPAAAIEVQPFGFGAPECQEAGRQQPGHGARAARTDLEMLAEAARQAATDLGLPSPRTPWPDPLPPRLLLDDLAGFTHAPTHGPGDAGNSCGDPGLRGHGAGQGAPVPFGLVDDPDGQRQYPATVAAGTENLLLYGVGGSGTRSALATIALAVASTLPPTAAHLYVLDMGSQDLRPLADLPHVGAVVGPAEQERQQRLLRTLHRELARRRDRPQRAPDGAPPPALMLLVDDYPGFAARHDDVAGLGVLDQLARLAAEGPALGLSVVMTGDRPTAFPVTLSALVPRKLVFRLADRSDRAHFGIPARSEPSLPSGRATDTSTGLDVQVALPGPDGLAAAVAALTGTTRTAGAAAAGPPADPGASPRPIPTLPTAVPMDQVRPSTRIGEHEWFLPLGIGDTDLAVEGFFLREGDHALVCGPARSGRSNVLGLLAALVREAAFGMGITAVALRRSPLRDHPAPGTTITAAAELAGALEQVMADPRPHLLLVDDAEDVDDPGGALATLLGLRRPDVHVVAAGTAEALRGRFGHWSADLRRSRQGLALQPGELDGDLWQVALPRRTASPLGPGRGYLIRDGKVELLQAAKGRGR